MLASGGILLQIFAAKDALDGDISDELIPFYDLKPRLNKSVRPLADGVGRLSQVT